MCIYPITILIVISIFRVLIECVNQNKDIRRLQDMKTIHKGYTYAESFGTIVKIIVKRGITEKMQVANDVWQYSILCFGKGFFSFHTILEPSNFTQIYIYLELCTIHTYLVTLFNIQLR